MNSTFLTIHILDTDALDTDALNTAPRAIPAQSRRTRAGQWDMFAVIGLMVCSAVYGICAIAAF